MARNAGARNSGTFITNDWRQLGSTNANESWTDDALNDFDVEEVKNGGATADVAAPVSNNAIGNLRLIAQEVSLLKQDNNQIKMVVYDLQKDRDNLRTAIRKLKVENSRFKAKLKRLGDAVKGHGGAGEMEVDQDEEVDYEDLRQFLLVGGPKDPFALQYNDAPVQDTKDPARTEHKSSERYYWYKLAQTFDDKEAMQKILSAEDSRKAEEIVKEVKGFDQATWDGVKVKIWEEAQRLKFEQHRWIKNLLIKTGATYIAVASQDKTLGTGWRKQREEASRTQLWDGENMGGKILMKLRDEFSENVAWTGTEEQDALQKFNDFRRSIWKPYAATFRSGGGGAPAGRRPLNRRSEQGAAGVGGVFPPPLLAQSVAARFGAKTTATKKRRQI